MTSIPVDFDPRIGLVDSVMEGLLVFTVSLDLTQEKLLRVIRKSSKVYPTVRRADAIRRKSIEFTDK